MHLDVSFRNSFALVFLMLGSFAGCGGSDSGGDAPSTTASGTGGASSSGSGRCVPATIVACSCADGSMGKKICKPDGTDYYPCSCGTQSGSTTSTAATTGTGGAGQGGSGTGATGGGMVGFAPEVYINHPSDGQERQINTGIPFIG